MQLKNKLSASLTIFCVILSTLFFKLVAASVALLFLFFEKVNIQHNIFFDIEDFFKYSSKILISLSKILVISLCIFTFHLYKQYSLIASYP